MQTLVARVTAGGLAAFWAVLWFGVIDLMVVVIQDERFYDDYLLESGWGLFYTVLVVVPLVVLALRPGDPVALAQLGVCAACVLLGAAWAVRLPQLLSGLALAATVALLAWLGRGRLPVRRPVDPVLAVLAAVALVGAVVYGHDLARWPALLDDITNGVAHAPRAGLLRPGDRSLHRPGRAHACPDAGLVRGGVRHLAGGRVAGVPGPPGQPRARRRRRRPGMGGRRRCGSAGTAHPVAQVRGQRRVLHLDLLQVGPDLRVEDPLARAEEHR